MIHDGGQVAVDATRLLLGLAVLLLAARGLGELAQRWGQPSVLGELLAGILLGPALCGRALPEASEYLFPATGPTHAVLEGFRTLAVALFLMVAGLEVDLSTAFQRGKAALSVSVAGIAAPFVLGLGVALAVAQRRRAGGRQSPVVLRALLRDGALDLGAAGDREDHDGSVPVQDRLRDDRDRRGHPRRSGRLDDLRRAARCRTIR